jgi:hypothetical protein
MLESRQVEQWATYEHAGSINTDNITHRYIQERNDSVGKHVLLEKTYT